MSAPVVNQAYSQQVNQAFDLFKTFTPQQMQQMGQQVAQKPNSPEAVAFAGAAQYQKQMKAPPPQAPQGTIFQQRLQEFQQTSPQGLPSVGGNQMAMQQAAQQDPMRNAGIGIAPENMPAPQQQAQAATGGLVALAQGGEVRHFVQGGGPLEAEEIAIENAAATEEEDDIANEGKWFDNFAKQAKNTGTDLLDSYKSMTAPKGVASAGLPSIDLGGDPSSPYGKYKAPTLDTTISDMGAPTTGGTSPKIKSTLSDFETAPKAKPKVKAHHSKKDTAPAPGSSAEANAASPTAKGETYKEPEVAVTPAKALTAEESIAEYQKLLGPEADMSEEVGMAKEAARGANKEKWGTALAQGLGGMLSAQTPYMSQALGAGLMSGVSGYQQGAKEEQTANKDLMALQMAQKKSDLAGHRAAAEAYIGQQAKMAEKAAEAHARMQDIQDKAMYEGKNALSLEHVRGANAANVAKIDAASAQAKQMLANMSEMDKARFVAGTLTAKDIAAAAGSGLRGGLEWKDIQATMEGILGMTGVGPNPAGSSNPFAPVGNSGVFYNQPKK
jgi:hypothetical protein